MSCTRCEADRPTLKYLFGLLEVGRLDEDLCAECAPPGAAWPVCLDLSPTVLAARKRAKDRLRKDGRK